MTTSTRPRRVRIRPTIDHGSGCDCPAHTPRARSPRSESEPEGRWAAVLPLLACLVCPACLSLYAKVFAAFGVGVALSERTHGFILALALLGSLAASAWRAAKSRSFRGLVITAAGSIAVVAGHVADAHWLEWLGVIVLLASGLAERRAARLARSHAG